MFTTEAEGRTPGVTHIQSAYWHNEGVVNSSVIVDTYYVAMPGFGEHYFVNSSIILTCWNY